MVLAALTAQAQQVVISLGTLEHPVAKAAGVRVAFDVLHAGQADVTIDELQIGDSRLRELKLHCSAFQLDEVQLSCADGTVHRGKLPPAFFTLTYRFDSSKLSLTMRDADIAGWAGIATGLQGLDLQSLHPVGRFDLNLTADKAQAKFDVAVRKLGFNTADYSIAGEGIAGTVSANAQRVKDSWQWRAVADWSGGEAFWSPWYRRAGVRMTAEGAVTPAQLRVDQARLTLDRLGSLTAGLNWDRRTATVKRLGFVTDPLDLSTAVKEWVQPILEARSLPSITASGTTRYAAEWTDGVLQSFYAGIENAIFKESTGRLTLNGVNASIPWSRQDETAAMLSVEGGMLDDFPLGGFNVPVRLHGFDVVMSQVAIPFLDGRIRIDDFQAVRPNDAWTGRFSGGIESVSMPRLTAAMGIPVMAGSLNMRIPSATYVDHVLGLGGDMVIEVFDGRITVRHLKLIDPLSSTSRFIADVEARRLDLGLLTSTFSFGSILGHLDADINALELQDWKPLAFRARLFSSAGADKRAISRGALIDISSLGGAAGAAAVRAIPAAGFFNTFSYDRIGLGCVLKDSVCHLDGIAPEGDGYVLVKGSGIPAVKVMGYNRSIDWNLLVSRIKAVIAGNTKAVIE